MQASPQHGLSQQAVRRQLQNILNSEMFSRSQRLSAFLRFVVEEALEGRGGALKEQAIALALHELLPNSAENDSVVRTDARRVRDKLREYYAEAVAESVIISLPKGTYIPVFTAGSQGVSPKPGPESVPAPSRRQISKLWAAAMGSFLVALSIAAWWVTRPPEASPRILAITQYPGGEGDPSFSPDGNFIALTRWSPPGPAPQDVWLKVIHGEALRQLTDTPPPVAEHNPVWSPDGKEIAFERVGWMGHSIPNPGIYIVSVLGGAERRISGTGRNPRWSLDGKSVLIVDGRPAGIVEINLDTLARRYVVQPHPAETTGKFAISPDGNTIAFLRYKRARVGDIYLAAISGGEPRQLTNWGAGMQGLAWTPDGRDIVYDVAGHSLWRIAVRGGPPGKGNPVPGLESLATSAARAVNPAISPPGPGRPARLAFQIQKTIVNLRMVELPATPSERPLPSKDFLSSTRVDLPGAISPDSEKIAFHSYLAAQSVPLWVVRKDGKELHQIGPMNAPFLKVGAWSPDGRHIAYDASIAGNSDIYVLAEDGGEPRRLTADPATDFDPSWSLDGRWIYFSSNRSGRPEIWKTSPQGGPAIQVTRTGGMEPRPSLDGHHLYYIDASAGENGLARTAALKAIAVEDGEEKVIFGAVRRGLWGITTRGILFLSEEQDVDWINVLPPSGETPVRLGRLPFLLPREFPRMAFSREGLWLLTNQVERRESDLMMIEPFR
ncbi:MAG: PD40 domain-containing protein [Bryobacterales bacterium]|nr:PD40 domain-containing protein [Bryobacterales bacterium]